MAEHTLPTASSVEYRADGSQPVYGTAERYRRLAATRGLAGLANDTKWNELLALMRGTAPGQWRPRYRAKMLDGEARTARWDGEWCYHLPFPLVCVEWMDLTCRSRIRTHRLPSTTVETDHAPWLVAELGRIGFDHMAGREMVRIFAYSPRDLTLFDEP